MKYPFPIIGYISVWPSHRIVKVKIDRCSWQTCGYPFVVTSLKKGVHLEKGVEFSGLTQMNCEGFEQFYIADPSLVNLYPSRKAAEKCELDKLHDQYLIEKRALAAQQKRVKWANKRIAEYKKFNELQSFAPDEI